MALRPDEGFMNKPNNIATSFTVKRCCHKIIKIGVLLLYPSNVNCQFITRHKYTIFNLILVYIY